MDQQAKHHHQVAVAAAANISLAPAKSWVHG